MESVVKKIQELDVKIEVLKKKIGLEKKSYDGKIRKLNCRIERVNKEKGLMILKAFKEVPENLLIETLSSFSDKSE